MFDTVVGYDGGADRVAGYASVTPDNVGPLVDGTIFTRGGKDKQNTAIFVGGGDMTKGEALLKRCRRNSSGRSASRRCSIPNGSNTTAAAGVALLAKATELKGKKAVVLAGTGPVGMRAGGLSRPGRRRSQPHLALARQRAENAAKAIETRFGVKVKPDRGGRRAGARQGRQGRAHRVRRRRHRRELLKAARLAEQFEHRAASPT